MHWILAYLKNLLPSVSASIYLSLHHTGIIIILFMFLNYLLTAYATQKHLSLYEKIAAEHARIGEEQLAQRLAFEATSIRYEEEAH